MKKKIRKGEYEYNDWHIERLGGFCTISRWSCYKGKQFTWGFTLKKAMENCDALDAGQAPNEIYLKPLYN